MTASEKKNRISIGKAAWQGIAGNFGKVTQVVVVRILGLGAALCPLLVSQGRGGVLPAPLAWLCSVLLYTFLVIPMRFWGREKMRRIFFHLSEDKPFQIPYQRWLSAGLLRYLKGLLWGLPFLACAAYFTIGRSRLDAKTFEAPIHWLSELLGGNVSLALAIIAALAALFGLLFAYGWWRCLAVEYLPVRSLKIKQVFHWAVRIRTNHGGELRKNAVVNFLLLLPAIVGTGVVLGLYLAAAVDFSLGAQMVSTLLLRTLRSPLPTLQMAELAVIFLVLYLPLCVLRKMRDAALIAHLMKGGHHSHHHHHHHHTDGEQEQEKASPADGEPDSSVKDGQDVHEA